MKKSVLIILFIAIIISALACSPQKQAENNNTATDSNITTTQGPESSQNTDSIEAEDDKELDDDASVITTIDELKLAAQNAYISEKGHYNAIAAFIEGNTDFLASYCNVDLSLLSGFETVKISDFKIQRADKPTFSLDFSFTVCESDYPAFPVGTYNYFIDNAPVSWHSYDDAIFSEKHARLAVIMNIIPSAVMGFEDSAPTLYEERFEIFAPYFIMQMENVLTGTGTTQEMLTQRVEEFFGIKDFVPDEKYFEIVDGIYSLTDSVKQFGVGVVHRIVDIHEVSDNLVEVDVCFFADSATLCLTHKITYTFEIGDFTYGYRLVSATVAEDYGNEPMRFNG
ncbi:MAG: hypothetical protein IKL24_01365 [Clostridia bacterium]|nr:hypothetical protein [Clostridia bacterium]